MDDKVYDEAYRKGRDSALRSEQTTTRIIAVLVAVTVVALSAIVAWSVHTGAQRDQVLRLACIDQGGIWLTTGSCGWSEGAAVTVEEDGSIAGYGCLQGYPCDDSAVKP